MTVLLDTNAYSAFMRGLDETVVRVRRARVVLLSAIVVGELFFGFRRGSRLEDNAEQLEAFLANHHVRFLPVTKTTADRFARIASDLRSLGKPIPTNDIWIAAHAMETGADLLSYDRHFEAVPGLAWVRLRSDGNGDIPN